MQDSIYMFFQLKINLFTVYSNMCAHIADTQEES